MRGTRQGFQGLEIVTGQDKWIAPFCRWMPRAQGLLLHLQPMYQPFLYFLSCNITLHLKQFSNIHLLVTTLLMDVTTVV
jgi:hypothetical protein